MTKYEQICRSYRAARREFKNYEETCRNFARDIVYGMIEYFEWPEGEEITYIPVGEEFGPNDRFYALAGAMRLAEDAFYHFAVELTARETPGGGQSTPFLLTFFIKKKGPHFIVKLGAGGREIRIHEEKKNELDPFFEAVFLQVVDFFNKGYIDAVTNQSDGFGFVTLPKSVTDAL